jgi:hypothetical protein
MKSLEDGESAFSLMFDTHYGMCERRVTTRPHPFASSEGGPSIALVAAIVASGVSAISSHSLSAWQLVPATPVGALVALGELWVAIKWLGRVFARTHLAQIDPPG